MLAAGGRLDRSVLRRSRWSVTVWGRRICRLSVGVIAVFARTVLHRCVGVVIADRSRFATFAFGPLNLVQLIAGQHGQCRHFFCALRLWRGGTLMPRVRIFPVGLWLPKRHPSENKVPWVHHAYARSPRYRESLHLHLRLAIEHLFRSSFLPSFSCCSLPPFLLRRQTFWGLHGYERVV